MLWLGRDGILVWCLAPWNWNAASESLWEGRVSPRAPPINSQLMASVWTISPMAMVEKVYEKMEAESNK
jgi:hypothetical protein